MSLLLTSKLILFMICRKIKIPFYVRLFYRYISFILLSSDILEAFTKFKVFPRRSPIIQSINVKWYHKCQSDNVDPKFDAFNSSRYDNQTTVNSWLNCESLVKPKWPVSVSFAHRNNKKSRAYQLLRLTKESGCRSALNV